MSLSLNTHFNNFASYVTNVNPDLGIVINSKIPAVDLKDFKCDENGNFTLVYDEAHEGQPIHGCEEKWNKHFENVSIKVEKEIRGKLYTAQNGHEGKIEFQSGLRAVKRGARISKWLPAVDVEFALRSVEIVKKNDEISYKVTARKFMKDLSTNLALEDIAGTKVSEWKKI